MVPTEIGREARLQLRVGVRQQRRRPVFVGDAEPAIGDVEADRLGLVDFLVAVFLQALVAEIADQAFMQDVIARDLRRAVARDQRERIERDRRGADIGDVILDGEEIAVVDRNGAAEGEALAIVVFQRHRVGRRQAAGAFLLPDRVLVGDARGRAGRRHPAELGVIGVRGVRGRVQHDRGRGRIDGLAELHQREVVDARALQRDAAGKTRRVDLDARAWRQSRHRG